MIKIPSPGELGLKIPSWRDGQIEGLRFLLGSTKRTKAACAPTGFGKSDLVVAYALITGEPTCIVTASRGLQDQYLHLYSHLGMVDIRGRRNYPCDMKPDATCEEGYASRCPYKGTIACASSQAEMRAACSSLVVTNYDKWCSARKYGQGMEHFKQVIFDEGHEGPEALARVMQVTLHHKEIEDRLKLEFLPHPEAESFENWKRWAVGARATAEALMVIAQARLTGVVDPKLAWVKDFTHLRNLTRRLGTLATASVRDWIVDEVKEGYQFDPVRPGKYAESALLLRVPSIVFVSATLRPKTMYMCGIGKDNFDYKEFESDFDPRKCPIYFVPTQRVDARQADLGMLWMRLDQTLSKRRDRKGLIQTTSYDYQKAAETNSRFKHSMLLNEKGEPPTEMIQRFLESPPGTYLVSPSVGQGYDFKDDASRFNAILKLPIEPPSKIQKAREADDREYRPYRTMQKLVQQLGRDVRSKTDWSERFIFDNHAEWFIPRWGHLAPQSFHGFYKTVTTLPQPPEIRL